MKVFYKYNNYKEIIPNRGDFITEYYIMKAISKFASVEYNTSDRDCDLYYMRGNPSLFKTLPNPKICFASPVDIGAIRCADAVSTFTPPWTKHINDGYIPLGDGTLDMIKAPKGTKAITVNQVIDESFKTLRNHPKTVEIREQMGDGFIIGHFGSVRHSSFPYSFMNILPSIKKKHPDVNVIFGGAGKTDLGKDITKMNFDYHEMPFATSACDLILYNVHNVNGHIGGSMKVLEAMACGIPVLAPRLDARVCELGNDYELFHTFENTDTRYSEKIEKEMSQKISVIIENEVLWSNISKRLIERSDYYSIDNSAIRFKKIFEGVMD